MPFERNQAEILSPYLSSWEKILIGVRNVIVLWYVVLMGCSEKNIYEFIVT